MKQLLIIGLILGLTNYSLSQDVLSEDKTISKSFSETEIQDLQLLYDFFNQSICRSERELEECYNDFFKKAKQAADSGSLYLHIPFEEQLQVYEKFQDSTFYQIWAFSIPLTSEDINGSLREVYFRWDGKFMRFLKKAGKKNGFIKVYYETVKVTGGPAPSLIAEIIMNYERLIIEDSKVKFVIAIHYLTLNDQHKRKENNKNSG